MSTDPVKSIETNDVNYVWNATEWDFIPDPILLKILTQLPVRDILNVSECCRRWNDISKDDYLWKKVFQRDFKVDKSIALKPGAESWYKEYKRLTYNIPMVLTDDLQFAHAHQVLHVSFSHNGRMFATCSKDGFVHIWNSSYPATIKYSHDMRKFSWKYTQYSQFNQSDTLLLVSGVHFGSPHSTSGEIAVFSVTGDSHLRCRVVNRPYDIFGTWFSDQHLISGDLHWLAHLVSTSVLWLNKANQEVDSEHVPIMNQLYKFYNRNASSIRGIMIANCPWLEDDQIDDTQMTSKESNNEPSTSSDDVKRAGNPLSQPKLIQIPTTAGATSATVDSIQFQQNRGIDNSRSIHYLDSFREEFEDNHCDIDNSFEDSDFDDDSQTMDEEMEDDFEDDDLENLCPKYLIFSTGSKTYTPHQIGFKRIRNVNFPKKLEPGPSLKERLAAKEREKALQNNERVDPDWLDYDSVANRFDKVDKLIDLHGHIIGMGLSPDQRYLYVNSRPWPKDYIISNPLEPPPIAQEIDIHVIDLATLKKVGNMLRSHKAYTPNTECFFIFLDVCDNYVASGAEDMHAYIWDRYYGICLAKYQHTDVVNSVAFNPRDSEMLVTTSDDYTIKIWRSVDRCRELNATEIKRAVEFRK
ncbi:F-box/WD repeat-containing protein 5 [Contarinia nasturtii]|uniref:F-box/WD repeat-containing protein 5 n=1 Tax=Contarinia nasturtii TaxID=265458 RepID=UPI0012D484F2|nr:F-box/WD repeat-containing protein 5 [Contarinia nasturtii]